MKEQLVKGIRRVSNGTIEIRITRNGKAYYGYAKTLNEAIEMRAAMKANLEKRSIKCYEVNYDVGEEMSRKTERVKIDMRKLEKDLEYHSKSKSELSYEIGRSSTYISNIGESGVPINVEALICKALYRPDGFYVLDEPNKEKPDEHTSELLKKIIEQNHEIKQQINGLSERLGFIEEMYERSIKTNSKIESNFEVSIQHLNFIRSKSNANSIQLEDMKRSLAKMESFQRSNVESTRQIAVGKRGINNDRENKRNN